MCSRIRVEDLLRFAQFHQNRSHFIPSGNNCFQTHAFKEFQPVMLRSFFSARSASTLAVVLLTLLCADVASAQEAAGGGRALIDLSAAFGVGLVVIGAAMGISRLAASAYESMARQPEVSGNIQTAMIIAAALIEGFTFYALFICSGK
jgi:F-type H+-transporting ATPase subunit c